MEPYPPSSRIDPGRYGFLHIVGHRVRRLLPAGLLLLGLGLLVSVFLAMRNTVWCFYTDDADIRREAESASLRPVLWNHADDWRGPLGSNGVAGGVKFLPDGARAIMALWDAARANSDLLLASWDGRAWSEPQPVAGLQSPANEFDAVVSRDGRYCFFTSERAGGMGGADIWLARWQGQAWGGITNLGTSLNSPAEERGLALTPDSRALYFASNRKGGHGGFDIYRARLEGMENPATAFTPTSRVVSAPCVLGVDCVDAVSSTSDDVDPELAPAGNFLYFASNRKRGHGGFDLYAARIVGGATQFPENLGAELNTPTDERAPALRMEGYDIAYRSGRDPAARILSATAREVFLTLDLSAWESYLALLDRIKWWVFAFVAALAALIYLVRRYRDLTNRFHKCLMASVILHLAALMLVASWTITKEVVQSMDSAGLEMVVNKMELTRVQQALDTRKDALSMDRQQVVANLPPSMHKVVSQQSREAVPIDATTPLVTGGNGPVLPTQTRDQSFVGNQVKVTGPERPAVVADSRQLSKLATLQVADVEPITMEEAPAESAPASQVSATVILDSRKLQRALAASFRSDVSVRSTAVSDEAGRRAAIDRLSAGPTAAVGGKGIGGGGKDEQSAFLEASKNGAGRGVSGATTGNGSELFSILGQAGGNSSSKGLRIGVPSDLEVPGEYANRQIPDLVSFNGRPSPEMVEALGGSDATEGAIRGSLAWFTRHQEADGRWSCVKHGGEDGHDIAATGLALLCYYGWGMKHNVECEYLKPVKAGITWLAAQVQPTGDLRAGNAKNGMYDQAIGAIALCEAYGVTHDPALLTPCSNAVSFIVAAQNPSGGWRYTPGSQDGDLSVVGWQLMALYSARMAGIPFSTNTLLRASRWIDRVSGGESGGFYGYQDPNDKSRPAMFACGMFCRQLEKFPPTHPRMKESAAFLRTRPLPGSAVDAYYLYYATLALYQHQGEVWDEWNARMKAVIPPIQRKTGEDAGSWDPQGVYGRQMGRSVMTALCTLSMEVYYRYLPMYGFRSKKETGQ